METIDQKIARLNTKPVKHLAYIFNVSESNASNLHNALSNEYFGILTDKSLSFEEMAKKTDLSRKTVNVYRSALITAGFDTPRYITELNPKKGKKDEARRESILSFVHQNPSTYQKIIEGINIPEDSLKHHARCLHNENLMKHVNVRRVASFFGQKGNGMRNRTMFAFLPEEGELLGREIVKEYFPDYMSQSQIRRASKLLGECGIPAEASMAARVQINEMY
jgi:hypothetical protein